VEDKKSEWYALFGLHNGVENPVIWKMFETPEHLYEYIFFVKSIHNNIDQFRWGKVKVTLVGDLEEFDLNSEW
jgi:hypothetical protein